MTIRRIDITPTKTYATKENAVKAVEKKFGQRTDMGACWYFIQPHREEGATDWRYFPVFVGQSALSAGVHFSFNLVA